MDVISQSNPRFHTNFDLAVRYFHFYSCQFHEWENSSLLIVGLCLFKAKHICHLNLFLNTIFNLFVDPLSTHYMEMYRC